MSKTESWKSWAAVIVVIIAFGVFAALWPALSGGLGNLGLGGGPVTKLPNESPPVVIEMPPEINVPGLELAEWTILPGPTITVSLPEMEVGGVVTVEGQTIIFANPIFAVLLVAAVVIGAVVVTGLILGLIYVLLSRWAERTKQKDSYQEHTAALEQKEKEKLKALNDGRSTDPPNAHMPRWSRLGTALLVCLFVIFGSMVLTTTFFPTREVSVGGELINPATIMVGIPLFITIAILLFAPRWGKAVLALFIMLAAALVTVAVVDIVGNIADFEVPVSTLLAVIGLVEIVTLVVLAYLWRPAAAETGAEKEEKPEAAAEESGIPYDGIVVLFTGLFVVGLGLGLTLLINSDIYEQIKAFLGF